MEIETIEPHRPIISFLVFMVAFILILVFTYKTMSRNDIYWATIFFLVVSILILGPDVYKKRCPSCGKWFAGRLVSEKELSSKVIDEDIGHIDTYPVNTNGNRDPNGITTETTVRKSVTQTTYRDYYECRVCGYKWERLSIRQWK